ncbi:Auxin response factor 4 [Nymphaea thermarum]|nr:Auxin response factor 4 [Nymphaea thermarum]
MEIDLNSALVVGKNCCSTDSAASCCTNTTASNSSISSGSGGGGGGDGCGGGGGSGGSICLELWHACAGTLISLPKKDHIVVYFPQGHLEQAVSASSCFKNLEHHQIQMLTYDLPPQIFCRVLDVNLHADQENDEVYAQVTLLPEPETIEVFDKTSEEEEEGGSETLCKSTPHMFCKTLTASDTSTHGGFSVPRRAAEDCFPPLDYSQQRPSQELVAKDLHGVEWRFRHIYRGQPRRHLLTTGWSIFVNQKGLVSGDAVLFLRGEDGGLRLGIRRACRPRNSIPYSVLCSQGLQLSILSPVANAMSTKNMFHVFYSPRASPAEFVIPYQKYVKSLNRPVSIGMRFKMRFEMEDSAEKRCNGVISGMGDLDPLKWPNSKWRCLMVRWDDSSVINHQERVSPWEIEPSLSLPALSCSVGPRIKRLQTCPQPDIEGMCSLDFGETVRSRKVLQGQENFSIAPVFDRSDQFSQWMEFKGYNSSEKHLRPAVLGTSFIGSSMAKSTMPVISRDLGESRRFQKVLQGQEVFPLTSQLSADVNRIVWGNCKYGLGELALNQKPASVIFPCFKTSKPCGIYSGNSYPLRSLTYDVQSSQRRGKCNSFTSQNSKQPIISSEFELLEPLKKQRLFDNAHMATGMMPTSRDNNQSDVSGNGGNSCMLFGLPLTKENNI